MLQASERFEITNKRGRKTFNEKVQTTSCFITIDFPPPVNIKPVATYLHLDTSNCFNASDRFFSQGSCDLRDIMS